MWSAHLLTRCQFSAYKNTQSLQNSLEIWLNYLLTLCLFTLLLFYCTVSYFSCNTNVKETAWKESLNRLCLGIKFIVRGRSRMTSLPSALHLLMFPFLSGAFPLAPSLCLLSWQLFVFSSGTFNPSLLLESFLGVRIVSALLPNARAVLDLPHLA